MRLKCIDLLQYLDNFDLYNDIDQLMKVLVLKFLSDQHLI